MKIINYLSLHYLLLQGFIIFHNDSLFSARSLLQLLIPGAESTPALGKWLSREKQPCKAAGKAVWCPEGQQVSLFLGQGNEQPPFLEEGVTDGCAQRCTGLEVLHLYL